MILHLVVNDYISLSEHVERVPNFFRTITPLQKYHLLHYQGDSSRKGVFNNIVNIYAPIKKTRVIYACFFY